MCKKKGLQCDVCIGCGRCLNPAKGSGANLSVVMSNRILAESSAGICAKAQGKRLVTVDIGTTTIAMQLHGEAGAVEDSWAKMNPQTCYGADVLSRIEAAGDLSVSAELRCMVEGVLKEGFERFQSQIAEDECLFTVLVANTTMIYLLMGYDAKELGHAPFKASHLQGIQTNICGVECLIGPGLSAFVGSDIVAGVYACDMTESDDITLLIDLGTNGEIVLGNRKCMIACATAAGPAFEGGVNRGIWGADMIQLLAMLLKEGIMDETGLLAEPYFDTGVRVGDVCVTQESIRAVQLAKGAIRAGIEILVKEYGITYQEVKRVVLAGGFGYYLKPEFAAVIGLLPEELAGKTISGGNTALAGALKLGSHFLREGDACLQRLDFTNASVINLAQMPEFEEIYLRELNFL